MNIKAVSSMVTLTFKLYDNTNKTLIKTIVTGTYINNIIKFKFMDKINIKYNINYTVSICINSSVSFQIINAEFSIYTIDF